MNNDLVVYWEGPHLVTSENQITAAHIRVQCVSYVDGLVYDCIISSALAMAII